MSSRNLSFANRALGTIQRVTDDVQMTLTMDCGRDVSIGPKAHPHVDHGYAVTSHSSQGQIGAKGLINNRMAYVSVSRGAHDAQIFTSDREKLLEALSRDVSYQSAHSRQEQPKRGIERQPKSADVQKQSQKISLSL